jgi:2-dehydropantoate 2-reductase
VRIAVFGSGGVGGYFGGRLAQAGESVVFVARGAHKDALLADGLRVESVAGDFQVAKVDVTDDPSAVGPVDAVLLAVKAWQVKDAARALLPLLGPETFVVPLQNGVEAADEVTEVVGSRHVVGGLCRIVSYVAAPGVVRHAGVPPRIELGERDGTRSERVSRLAHAFSQAQGVSVDVPDDIEAAVWEKFLFIAPFSGVGAVTRVPAGELRREPETRWMLEQAMSEIEAVASARGIAVRADVVPRCLGIVDSLPEDATASMQRDILEGRPSELEYQNGAVVRLGRAAGVPVPVHACLYASLLPLERRARGQ